MPVDILLGVFELGHAPLDVAIFVTDHISDLHVCGHQPIRFKGYFPLVIDPLSCSKTLCTVPLAYCLQSVQEASHYCMSAFRGGDEHLTEFIIVTLQPASGKKAKPNKCRAPETVQQLLTWT